MAKNRWPFKKSRPGSCANSHPALDLVGAEIYGGSCHAPVPRDCDVYISLDQKEGGFYSWPWTDRVEVLFSIPNYKSPTNVGDFARLVEWTLSQLDEGKKVHAGCFAGHGRTGLLFAAMVASLNITKDPIGYVRKHYCPNAVESIAQIDFLVDVYGCKMAKAREYPKLKMGKGTLLDSTWPSNTRTAPANQERFDVDGYDNWLNDWRRNHG